MVTKWYLFLFHAPVPAPRSLYSLTVTVTDAHPILQFRSHFITESLSFLPHCSALCVSPPARVYRLNDLLTTLHFIIDRHASVTISDVNIQDAGRADLTTLFEYLGDFPLSRIARVDSIIEARFPKKCDLTIFFYRMECSQDLGQTLTSTNA